MANNYRVLGVDKWAIQKYLIPNTPLLHYQ
jgi:hypothetical protein